MLLEKAPPGHIPLQIDDENAFVLIALALERDPQSSTQADSSSDDLMQFGQSLHARLSRLGNVRSHLCTTDDFAYEDDLPVNVSSIVTNEPELSHWYDRGGRNRVDVSCKNGILRIESRGIASEFWSHDLASAVNFAAGVAAHFPDTDNADDAPMLSEPVTNAEFAGIEAILSQLQRAIELGELTEAQRDQVQMMARALRQEQQAAEPGQTARLGLVQALRFIIRVLRMLPLPDEFWAEIADILRSIGWLTMFGDLTD